LTNPIFVSTACFKQLAGLERVLADLAEAGYRNIELSGGHDPVAGSVVELLTRWRREAGLEFIVHNYFPVPAESFLLNLGSLDDDERRRSVEFCTTALRVASEIESPVYAAHPGYIGSLQNRGDDYFFPEDTSASDGWPADLAESYDALLRSIDALAPTARKLGVRFAVENLFPLPELPPQLMVSAADWRRFFSDTDGSGVGLLFDVAHLKISHVVGGIDVDETFEWLFDEGLEHLVQVHVSDNSGTFDDHDPIAGDSTPLGWVSNWRDRKVWPAVPVTYESRGLTVAHLGTAIPLIRRAFAGPGAKHGGTA
jgi:sugar phosphate isomerase/epimerase